MSKRRRTVTHLQALQDTIDNAESALLAETKRVWPEGMPVLFWIRSNQQLRSLGTVVGHWGPYLTIRMNTGTVKRVHWSKIDYTEGD